MKYTVTVKRTEYKDFTVEAESKEEAREIAEGMAEEHLWGGEYADYEIEEPVTQKEKLDSAKNNIDPELYAFLKKIIECC